jgi:hypothetical protein
LDIEARERHQSILELSKEFVKAAKPIVNTIIDEIDFPFQKKTIKPALHVDGVAGNLCL